MTDARPRLGGLLHDLCERGELSTRDLERARTHLETTKEVEPSPWFLQPFVCVGALIAACMLAAGAYHLFDLYDNLTRMLVLGAVHLVLALVLHRIRASLFTDYLGLAFGLVAQFFILVAVVDWSGSSDELRVAFTTSVCLTTALYGLHRDPLHRFLSCLLVCVLARLACTEQGLEDLVHVFVLLTAGLCAWALTQPRERPACRPLAYAAAAGLVVLLLPISERGLWFDDDVLPRPWISSSVAGLALLFALWWAARRAAVARGGDRPTATRGVIATLVVIGLAALGTPGIPAALFLMVLGHATHHWLVALIGLASLPMFVWQYYYDLDVDLMVKSGILCGSGALLLLARVAIPVPNPDRNASGTATGTREELQP